MNDPVPPRCDKCGKGLRYLCGDWTCIVCFPQARTQADKKRRSDLGAPRIPVCKTCGSAKEPTTPESPDARVKWVCRSCQREHARKQQIHRMNKNASYRGSTELAEVSTAYRNRASDCQAQASRIHHQAKPPKPPWEPVWAAQSTPEIVAAVREARAAQRRLGVGR